MGKNLKLITIKEYCKENDISDSGVRKQIKEKRLTSLVYNDLTYIVIESNVEDKLRDTIKLLREQKKTLKKEILGLQKELSYYEDQKEELKLLKEDNRKLQLKYEERMDKQVNLMEKVVGHYENSKVITFKEENK
jgi:hypothetical protein